MPQEYGENDVETIRLESETLEMLFNYLHRRYLWGLAR